MGGFWLSVSMMQMGNFVESEAGGKFAAFQLRVTASTHQVGL